ncbi:MAG TPA: MoxR family ATPase [Spirochaetia bacterium]|nr:MoxR family ATPase [Spirochaetia bacterium]
MSGETTVAGVASWASAVRESVRVAFRGSPQTVDRLLVALLCRGHVLIEDVPGVGKTVLARALALSVGGIFRQVQCTPDLLPADVLGVSLYNQATGAFEFRDGPIMTNVLLVDEINRATPRTQSAFLEAMAEGQVSVEGRSIALPDPFLLVATESPVESEGTFPLPEVQKDRFFLCLHLGYPSREDELAVMVQQRRPRSPLEEVRPAAGIEELREMQRRVLSVHVSDHLRAYILALVSATRSDPRLVLGVSPRGSLALYKGGQALAALRGRSFVTPEDIRDMALPVLQKRLILKSEPAGRGLTEENVVQELLSRTPIPPLED